MPWSTDRPQLQARTMAGYRQIFRVRSGREVERWHRALQRASPPANDSSSASVATRYVAIYGTITV